MLAPARRVAGLFYLFVGEKPQPYGGRPLNFKKNPMDIFSSINSNLQRLSHIRRYAALPVHRAENVAEHSFYCILYASLIARDLIAQGLEVNHEQVMVKALHHDLEEAMTGDIIRSFKYTTPELRAEIQKAGEIHMQELTKQLGDAKDITYTSWATSKDDSIEGHIVKLADQLCLVAYLREEILSGNRHLIPVAKRAHKFIQVAAVDELACYYSQVYPTGEWDDILRAVAGDDS